MNKKVRLFTLLLFPVAILINFIGSKFPHIVENYYSLSFNKFTVQILSRITGIIPFSLYEFTMYLIVISIVLFLISIIFITIKDIKKLKTFLKNSILNILSFLSIAYFLFIILWGLNYNRLPLEYTILNKYNSDNNSSISTPTHTAEDLSNLYAYLIDKTNETRKLVSEDNNKVMKCNSNYKGVIDRAQLGYDSILNIIPSVSGTYSKPKFVISSNLMCYTGITGIYFPWTGEANVNIAVPDMYIPSTVLHEMAHQRGFASEDEANFLAYLSSINHPDIDFNYSGYILALSHTASALRKADPKSHEELTKKVSQDVFIDLKNNSEFWKKYEGDINKISNDFNNTYLKSNGIKDGTESYGKMVDLLLTYYSLYPFK